MLNFIYHNSTELLFGPGMTAGIAQRIPTGPILLVIGGGSVRRNGALDQVMTALVGREVHLFEGIEPNPEHETCLRAVALARRVKAQFVLAVGGGSVADAAKYIAAVVPYSGDPWEILSSHGKVVEAALPLGVVLTLPATGSEANGNSVISRAETQEKLHFGSLLAYPRFSVLDPTFTLTLPAHQVRNGIVDAFVHVMEQYATFPSAAQLQDRMCEAVVATLLEAGPRCLSTPEDLVARADLMWSATMALNGLVGVGVPQDWSTHMVGHELTAFYGLAHAESLAIVLPGIWEAQREGKREKLAQLGRRLFALVGNDDEVSIATIGAVEAFFQRLGMPTRLSAYKIDAEEAAKRIGARFAERSTLLGERRDLDAGRVEAVLRGRG